MKWQIGMAIVLLLTMSGCVPTFGRYHYIELVETPGLKVVEHGVSRYGSFFHEAMPVGYRLQRGPYSVELEVRTGATAVPAMNVGANSTDGFLLLVEPMDSGKCSSWQKSGRDRILEFNWYGRDDPQCAKELPENKTEYVMRFNVIDEAGATLGEERLPFALVRNGLFRMWDAI